MCIERATQYVLISGATHRGVLFFQFWTGDASTAGTIVRLLPTTRTIEYEGASAVPFLAQKKRLLYRQRVSARILLSIAACVGLIGIASLVLTTDRVLHWPRTDTAQSKPTTTAANPGVTTVQTQPSQARPTTAAEVAAAAADLERFDARIDGLRAQYRMAFAALQYGTLSREDFVDGLNRWLIPQWQALHRELILNPPAPQSLDSVLRKHLLDAAIDWNEGLVQYITGLQERNDVIVLRAFERMSAGNQSQWQALDVIDRAARATSIQP
jgi:hypothetical protein